MQNVIFIDGDFIQYIPNPRTGTPGFNFRGWDKAVMQRVVDGIGAVEDMRHQSHFIDRIFLLWLSTRGYTYYIFRMLFDLAFGRFTVAKAVKYLNGADHMNSAFIESDLVEFSVDIDHPQDLQEIMEVSLYGKEHATIH